MRYTLLCLFLFMGCSQKYIQYPVIEKRTFEGGGEHAPSNPPPMIKAKKEIESFCEGQIFFNKNAFNITESSVRALVQHSCPGSKYLIDAKITKTWWTTLVYSRSCVEVESYCPRR